MLLASASSARRRASVVNYGPRVTPGVAGAVNNPDMGGRNEVRLSSGTYSHYELPANSFVLPEIGASVTLAGEIFEDDGAGSVIYGCTLDAGGDPWAAAFIDAGNITIAQCDITGAADNDTIRISRPNCHIIGCLFDGVTSGQHSVLFFTGGSGSVRDCQFDGTPGEDHIQCADIAGDVLIEHCSFTDESNEDAVDTKPASGLGKVTVRGCDFTAGGSGSESILCLNFGDVWRDCRFGNGTISSIGTHQVAGVWAEVFNCVFSPGSELRLRLGTGSQIHHNTFDGATITLGTQDSPGDDFPTAAWFHHNVFEDLTIDVSNANSTTVTNDNTYVGSTTGTFPSGNQ